MNHLKFVFVSLIFMTILLSSCNERQEVIYRFDNISFSNIKDIGTELSYSLIDEYGDSIYLGITDVCATSQYEILITDRYNGEIHVFDSLMNFKKSFGRIGRGPGEFTEYPLLLNQNPFTKEIIINDASKPVLKIFSSEGKFIKDVYIYNPILSMDCSGDGIIGLGILSLDPIQEIFVFNEIFEKMIKIKLQNLSLNFQMDTYILCINKKNKEIIVVFNHRNNIQFYSSDGELIRETSISNLPHTSNITYSDILKRLRPISSLFYDVESDKNGNIYLLCNGSIKDKKKIVLVLSPTGEIIGKITLVEQAINIFIRDNKLYAISNDQDNLLIYDIEEI